MAKSLAAQSGALTQELQLPAVFQAPQEPVKARFIAPYIAFAHPKRADEWAKLVVKFGSVTEGEMYLIRPNNQHHLSTAKLGWMCCKQYWGEANAAGEMLRTSFKELPRPFKEHIEAVVLVYLPDEIVPANISFRSTKCPAAKTLADTLMEASKPDWGERSPQHKETLVCAQPFMRFFGEVSLGPQRVSKNNGLPYRTTVCTVRPTSVTEWRMLKAFTENASTQQDLQNAADRFETRMKEVQTKLIK